MTYRAGVNISRWLEGQVVIFAILLLFSLVYSRARSRFEQAKTLDDLQRNGKVVVGMLGGLFVADFLLLAGIGLFVGGLSGWVTVAIGLIVGAWVIWNVPARRRLILVDAETDIAGDPDMVSAFFADVRDWGRWQTGLISSVETGMGIQGPRFHLVGTIPGSNRQMSTDVTLRVNKPGAEVIVGAESAGLTSDQFYLTPAGTGTHVLNREVLELPFVLAVFGGMLLARDKDRQRRHTEELARAKAVFEAAHSDPA